MAGRGEFRLDSEYPQGVDDPALRADCRGTYGSGGFVRPWVALSSCENWSDDVLTPQGLPDGEQPIFSRKFRALDELEVTPYKIEHTDFDCDREVGWQRAQDEQDELDLYVEEDPFYEYQEEYELGTDTVTVFAEEPEEDIEFLELENLPTLLSPRVVRDKIDSQKALRQGSGRRGGNRYKLLRRGRVRVTNRKSLRVALLLNYAFVYYVPIRHRVVCHGAGPEQSRFGF
ncbi:MAG: hypothetical protein G01um101448_403 [Parcubacteria group bacterium Gr01-1014_48]|nr:MAG: hypothetical protein Greene041614_758 [Parcubacteria group bacterium Greene0416_14]TSC74023.1 MAG: hypothetical protein G01um101448_403 [Parcubacteria group bacterium Gr01-1014_48]TSD00801.1 MAG: hypothetical protein Greene101415_701 [Parcubacteria group bacterium Greene1014_15]TSD07201.1 MAG: hypothetical protein Greene07144_982 [Parcubacteria group bacterium Greene0714_4]